MLVSAFGMRGQTLSLTCTPSGLSEQIDNPPSVTSLALTGIVDAADLHFVATRCTSLQSLDLSGARIAAYSGTALATNRGSFGPDTLPDYCLSGCTASHILLPATLKAIGEGALMSTSVTTLAIPESVTSIGRGALADCRSLKSVTIPASVASAGQSVLSGCTALQSLTWLAGDVPQSACRGCTALTQVTLNARCTQIGAGAFSGCTSLESLPEAMTGVTAIGSDAFYQSGLKSADLQPLTRLRSIGAQAFACCPELEEVLLGSSATTLGRGAMMECPALTMVLLPEGLAHLPAYTFAGSQAIDTSGGELFTPMLESADTMAMAGLNRISAVALPASLQYLGPGCMEAWRSLSHIDASALDHVPALGADVWQGIDPHTVALSVQPAMTGAFEAAPQWQDFTIGQSGSTGLTPPAADATGITARLEGHTLTVETAAGSILSIDITATDGRRLSGIRTDSPTVGIDLSRLSAGIVIISVTATQGRTATFKTLLK